MCVLPRKTRSPRRQSSATGEMSRPHICIAMYTYIYIYIYTDTHIQLYIHTYSYICIRIIVSSPCLRLPRHDVGPRKGGGDAEGLGGGGPPESYTTCVCIYIYIQRERDVVCVYIYIINSCQLFTLMKLVWKPRFPPVFLAPVATT